MSEFDLKSLRVDWLSGQLQPDFKRQQFHIAMVIIEKNTHTSREVFEQKTFFSIFCVADGKQ